LGRSATAKKSNNTRLTSLNIDCCLLMLSGTVHGYIHVEGISTLMMEQNFPSKLDKFHKTTRWYRAQTTRVLFQTVRHLLSLFSTYIKKTPQRRILNEGAKAKERNGRTSTELIRSLKFLGMENMKETATNRSILDNMLDRK
jgi:hypothetical protein